MMMKVRRRILLTMLSAATVGGWGCGSGLPHPVPTEGIVILDGRPVAGAAVLFAPDAGGRPATGQTDEEGRFKLTTFEEHDGAVVGTHKVTVTLVESSYPALVQEQFLAEMATNGGSARLPRDVLKWVVPKKYSFTETSGLTATVPENGVKDLQFELVSDPL